MFAPPPEASGLIGQDLLELLMKILSQIAREIVQLLPKIFIALVVTVLTFVAIKILNISMGKLLKVAELDHMIQRFTGVSIPFSISRLLIVLADLGVGLIGLYAVVDLLLGAQYVKLMTDALYYGARVVSIVAITFLIFVSFNMILSRVVTETRLRGYMLYIILLLVTAMLIDITALSEHVKSALITGLSLGVGISIGVFAIWFFFRDYLDRVVMGKRPSSSTNGREGG